MPLNSTLKIIKMVNFMLCTFYHNKRRRKKMLFFGKWTGKFYFNKLKIHI